MTHSVENGALRKMPLRAPAWLWVAYCVLVAALAALATTGGISGFFAVVACAGFSFQFWTFAAWRGHVIPPGGRS